MAETRKVKGNAVEQWRRFGVAYGGILADPGAPKGVGVDLLLR